MLLLLLLVMLMISAVQHQVGTLVRRLWLRPRQRVQLRLHAVGTAHDVIISAGSHVTIRRKVVGFKWSRLFVSATSKVLR